MFFIFYDEYVNFSFPSRYICIKFSYPKLLLKKHHFRGLLFLSLSILALINVEI